MSDLPKIVKERLQAQQTPAVGDHPDADLLAAFAEQRLGTREREQVLAHLASCADCRQVIAISFPAEAGVQQPVAEAARERAWHEWWIFRWAGLAAALAVILIAVFLARPRGRTPQEAAARADLSDSGQAPLSTTPAASLPTVAAEPQPAPKHAPAKQKPMPATKLPVTAPASGSGSGAGIGGGAYRVAPTPQVPAQNAASPGAANQVVEVQSSAAAPMNAAEPVRPLARDEVAKSQAPVPGAPTSSRKMESAPKSALRAGTVGGLVSAQAVGAVTRWSISRDGRVQRSMDGGRTWQDAGLAEGAEFRVVSVLVPEIWAGGAHGMLFHSADGGDHWTRIPVSAAGQALTGDITHIELRDRDHLDIVSSSGERWQTADRGATWKLLTNQP